MTGLNHGFALTALLALAGCSTVASHTADAPPVPYAGTKMALAKTQKYWNNYDIPGQVVFFAMDVPLCLVADTVLLPVDLFRSTD